MKAFLIAGTHSGCGKTTVSIGLMALLSARGHRVAPFKAGPDFIDPLFHEAVTGRHAHNLDTHLLQPEVLRALFARHAAEADVAVVEGVMGLYDGMGHDAAGSSARLAKLLDLPVILVLDCQGLYQSVAAIVRGFVAQDPGVRIGGVILNNVASAGQFAFMRDFLLEQTGIEALGWLPPSPDLAIGSRHLGLVQAEEIGDLQAKVARLVERLAETVDLKRLLELAAWGEAAVPPATSSAWSPALQPFRRDLSGLRLAVAQDRAFRFYYRDNLRLLSDCGAELLPFSPLAAARLPDGANALYLGGGYPEVFAEELSANEALRSSIRQACRDGLPTWAECGGLMYLCRSIITDAGAFPMAGVFECDAEMTKALQRFGYARLELDGASGPVHEFHHSRLSGLPAAPDWRMRYRLGKPDSGAAWECGLFQHRTLAGYAHLHFWSSPELTGRIFEHWLGAGPAGKTS